MHIALFFGARLICRILKDDRRIRGLLKQEWLESGCIRLDRIFL